MAVSKKVTRHLEKRGVKFSIVTHRKVYTAYDLAQTLGEDLGKIAKSLLVRVDLPVIQRKGKYYFVVVLPASYRVDVLRVRKALKAVRAKLAPEAVMKRLGMKPGALVPFGSIYGLGTVMDKSLLRMKEALMGAESLTESLRMRVKDFVKAEQPVVASVGVKGKAPKKQKARKRAARAKRRPSMKHKTRPDTVI
ncbi:MAG: YbaK/EbsC family protein [Patescibacteria group bacterium]